MNPATATAKFRNTLESEAGAYGVSLAAEGVTGLSRYYELLNVWNARIHLVAPCTPQEFAKRHILESLTLLKYLPTAAGVADVGSGAGLPILPCLIVRADLRAVLIEASKKKAVFLREALSRGAMSARASIIDERFEGVVAPQVDFVSCRALERFEEMLPQLLEWAPAPATLLLFGGKQMEPKIAAAGFSITAELMPNSNGRFLFVVNRP